MHKRMDTYRADPVDVRADSGKDSGLLGVVAAEPRAKADNTVNLPDSSSVHTVQRTTRVSLSQVGESKWSVCEFHIQQLFLRLAHNFLIAYHTLQRFFYILCCSQKCSL